MFTDTSQLPNSTIYLILHGCALNSWDRDNWGDPRNNPKDLGPDLYAKWEAFKTAAFELEKELRKHPLGLAQSERLNEPGTFMEDEELAIFKKGDTVIFNHQGLASEFDYADEEGEEASRTYIENIEAHHMKPATIEGLATYTELGDKDYEYYDIIFEDGFELDAISGYHLDKIIVPVENKVVNEPLQTEFNLLAWVKEHQEDIINHLIRDTDPWAGEDTLGNSPKKRLLQATPRGFDFEKARNTVMIDDGEDNTIFINLSWDDAYFGISTHIYKPPRTHVHEYKLHGVTFYVTFG